MIKRRFKLFAVIFILLSFITLSSCSSNKESNKINSDDNINEKADQMQKYVIELNTENWSKYIDVRSQYGIRSNGYAGKVFYYIGTLSYAYYDNVYINGLQLSAGGYADCGDTPLTVNKVSGKVIYWI